MSTQPTIKLTILYIDDNQDNGYMLSRRLERLGVKCIVSATAIETIQLIIQHDPDVVLLDLHMPRISGFEVLAKIRNHETVSSVPVWAFTANSGSDMRSRCLSAGFDGFIAKPIMRPDIQELIRQFVPQ